MKIEATCHDTLLQHHALYPKASHDLQAVAAQHLAVKPWKSEFDLPFAKLTEVKPRKELKDELKKCDKQLKRKRATDDHKAAWSEYRDKVEAQIGEECQETIAQRWEWLQHYNAIDTIVTDEVDAVQSRQLEQYGVWPVYENDREIMRYAVDWWKVGVGIDQEMRDQTGREYLAKLNDLKQRLCDVAGRPDFNPASPPQLRVILKEQGIVPTKLTPTGDLSTSEQALFTVRDHPFVANLLEYRGLAKLESTYIRGMGAKLGPDGRLHPVWSKHVTPSGRFSTKPNIQNWPDDMKRMLRPAPGRVIIACDYAALELRLSVLFAGEEELIKVFQEGGDVHSLFAETYFAEAWKHATPEVRKQLRKDGKSVTFGDIYRAGAQTLWEQVRPNVPGITLEQVAVMQQRKRAKYQNINKWAEMITDRANRDLQLLTPWLGRVRRWPLGQVQDTEATNHPIQGGAADIVDAATKRWVRRLKAEGLYHTKIFPNIQIHDDLRCEVVEGYELEAAQILKECMETEIEWQSEITGKRYTMPFIAEPAIGRNHGSYHPEQNPDGVREMAD